jgi:hypothetical protein
LTVAYWLDQLRGVLSDFYPANGPADVVGYLKGSGNPDDWRIKERAYSKPQFLILGNAPPDQQDWINAGKFGPGDGQIQVILPEMLKGLIIVYGGFGPKPWGEIRILDDAWLKSYQSSTIERFRSAVIRHRHG